MSTPQIWNIGIGIHDAMKKQPGWQEVVLASEYAALEARCRALELQLAAAQANADDQRAMKAKAREQRNAVTAELAELRKDKVRLDFIERQPGMSLRNHKKGKLWIFGGFSNYEQTFYPSLRMAIDATMEGRE